MCSRAPRFCWQRVESLSAPVVHSSFWEPDEDLAGTHAHNISHLFLEIHELPEAHKRWFRRSLGQREPPNQNDSSHSELHGHQGCFWTRPWPSHLLPPGPFSLPTPVASLLSLTINPGPGVSPSTSHLCHHLFLFSKIHSLLHLWVTVNVVADCGCYRGHMILPPCSSTDTHIPGVCVITHFSWFKATAQKSHHTAGLSMPTYKCWFQKSLVLNRPSSHRCPRILQRGSWVF